jgi:hypothetical protein
MATPAQKEINEPTGKFLRPQNEIAYFQYLSLANEISAAVSRQLAKFVCSGEGRPAELARAGGLSKRDCSH